MASFKNSSLLKQHDQTKQLLDEIESLKSLLASSNTDMILSVITDIPENISTNQKPNYSELLTAIEMTIQNELKNINAPYSANNSMRTSNTSLTPEASSAPHQNISTYNEQDSAAAENEINSVVQDAINSGQWTINKLPHQKTRLSIFNLSNTKGGPIDNQKYYSWILKFKDKLMKKYSQKDYSCWHLLPSKMRLQKAYKAS